MGELKLVAVPGKFDPDGDELPEPNAPPGVADVPEGLAAISDGFCGDPGLGVLDALLYGLDFEKGQIEPPLWQPASPSSAMAANA